MAERWAWIVALCAGLLLAAGTASAESRERVVLVAAAIDGAPARSLLPTLDRVRVQLGLDGREEVRPDVTAHARAPSVADARTLGRTAFSALSTERPDVVASLYEARIREALEGVSAERGGEARGVLWNLCVLRVQLRAQSDDAQVRTVGAREAAADCVRRFRERPALGKVWPEEVVRAFDDAARNGRVHGVAVKSAPAGCEALVYGTSVGLTPVVVDLGEGPQEVQVVCEGKASALHRMQVDEPRELVIRMTTDAAVADVQGAALLRYPSQEALEASAEEDAATLAAESGADAFVVVKQRGADAEVVWRPLLGEGGGRARVLALATSEERARRVKEVFHAELPARAAPVPARGWAKSPLADYLLGGGLLVGGGLLAVPPFLAIARDGECTDKGCNHVYDGGSGTGVALLVGAGVLATSGVAVLIWKPFGRRTSVAVGTTSVSVKGTF